MQWWYREQSGLKGSKGRGIEWLLDWALNQKPVPKEQ
jgi:hypothetical protein